MLIGGTDVSGDRHGSQHNHTALIIGKEDEISRIYSNIGISPIHMSEITEQERQHVYDNLDFSSNEIRVWCFHISRRQIENNIRERLRTRKSRKPRINIHKNFDTHWFRLFRNDLETFAAKLRTELSEIVIEADSDMVPTLKNWNINSAYKGKAYELSDAVAWFNQKEVRLGQCKIMDLRTSIEELMKHGLLK